MLAQNQLSGALVVAFISFSRALTLPGQNGYKEAVIEQHNLHRANHSAPDLLWDADVATIALKHAKKCDFEHTSAGQEGSQYGENLALSGSSGQTSNEKINAVRSAITNGWYNREVMAYTYYGESTPENYETEFSKYGHFTQLVWKATTKVGCGTELCKVGTLAEYPTWYTVCNYEPAGNVEGEYAENVLEPLGEPIEVVPDA